MHSSSHQADWVLDLMQQGLLPLPLRSVLTARLVCQHWKQRLSTDITHITFPYDAWATASSNNANNSAQQPGFLAAVLQDQTGWRSAATAAAAALAAACEDDETQHEGGQAVASAGHNNKRKQQRGGSSSSHTQAAGTNAASVGGAGVHASSPPQQHTADVAVANTAAVQDAVGETTRQAAPPPAGAGAGAGAGAAVASAASQQQQQHPLQHLSSSLPAVTHITLSNRRSAWYNPQAPCGAAVIATAVQLMGRLPRLHSLSVQGYLAAADWTPLLPALAGPQQQHQQQQVQQQEEEGEDGIAHGQQQDTAAAAAAIDVDTTALQQAAAQASNQHQQAQQQEQYEQQLVPLQQLPLRTQLVSLDLESLELPPPLLLELLLGGLSGLRSLRLHASMESILEGAHLDALATGTQLTSLELKVYQAAHSRCPLDSLMSLTRLQHLDVAYGGIFADQRPALSQAQATSNLVHLTYLASSGLAQPLLPQPNITTLCSLRVAGLTKRLPETAVQLISSCNSSALRDLRLEGGRRGIAAVAADHLDHLGFMTQLTSLSLALSKGSLPAGKSAQQLQKLAGLTNLRTLWLGSGDHRLGLSTEQLQEFGGQWPSVNSLKLSGFSPLQGFAGLGAFTGLTQLSMKPGVGTGKLLLELDVALQQLSLLRRLHLDFRSALTIEHIEAITTACSSRLQHLSLNMWAPGIGSKALVAIGSLSVLTSLQLINMRAAVLSGPPGIAALREMPSLELLCVQAADEVITDQQPLPLGAHLSEVLTGHMGPLREVRIWLGSGVEARQAEAAVAKVVEVSLPDCRCKVLKEPEKAIL